MLTVFNFHISLCFYVASVVFLSHLGPEYEFTGLATFFSCPDIISLFIVLTDLTFGF